MTALEIAAGVQVANEKGIIRISGPGVFVDSDGVHIPVIPSKPEAKGKQKA